MTLQEFTFPADEVPAMAVAKGVDRFYADRIRSMAWHASIVKGTPYGDNERLPFIGMAIKEPARWPLGGVGIVLTRQDGRRFALRFNKETRQFTVTDN